MLSWRIKNSVCYSVEKKNKHANEKNLKKTKLIKSKLNFGLKKLQSIFKLTKWQCVQHNEDGFNKLNTQNSISF